jgi:DNA-binding NarL/FixJ family response regulator
MNVLLVDDHILFRQGLIHLLDGLDSKLTFFQADGVTDELDRHERIDLVLLDMHMRGPEGTDALAAVRTQLPDATIVVLSGDEDPDLIERCIQLGACGFIPKSSSQAVLMSALRLVLAGGVYLPAEVLGPRKKGDASQPKKQLRWADLFPDPKDRGFVDVLHRAVKGKSNKVIAREMNISISTVKYHLSNAYAALQVDGRTKAIYKLAALGVQFDDERQVTRAE